MSATPIAPIELLRVLRVGSPDQSRQRIAPPRQRDQVDVIGHPAPAQQRDPAGLESLEQKSLVAEPVFVGQEDVPAVIAALSDVMRCLRLRRHSRLARHRNRRWLVCHTTAALGKRLRPHWSFGLSLWSFPWS